MKSFTSHTFRNGLKALCIHAPQSPVLYVSWGVSAGSAQDNIAGMAHLCEHLMFLGTSDVPDYDERLVTMGAENNAWTDQDKTIYEIETEASQLEDILYIEADRWKNLSQQLNPSLFEKEKQVVINELREGFDTNPLEKWEMQNPQDMFGRHHPYGHAIIGNENDIASIAMNDVQEFYHRCYQPQNSIICVAGNVDEQEVYDLIDSYWGDKNNNPTSLYEIPFLGPSQNRHIEMILRNTPPILCLQWIIEPTQSMIAEIWTQLLTSEQYGDLYHTLVLDNYWALDIEAQVAEHPTLSIVEIRISLVSEDYRQRSKEMIQESIQRYAKKGVPRELIHKIQKNIRLIWYLECEKLAFFTESLLCWSLHHSSSLEEHMNAYQKIQPIQIQLFCQQILSRPYIESHCYAKA